MLVFIASEATFFLFLIITYVYYHSTNVQGPGPAEALNVGRTAVFSVFLFVSSATVSMAGRAFERGNRAAFERWLAATIVLGAIFIGGQIWEYAELYANHVTPA